MAVAAGVVLVSGGCNVYKLYIVTRGWEEQSHTLGEYKGNYSTVVVAEETKYIFPMIVFLLRCCNCGGSQPNLTIIKMHRRHLVQQLC